MTSDGQDGFAGGDGFKAAGGAKASLALLKTGAPLSQFGDGASGKGGPGALLRGCCASRTLLRRSEIEQACFRR